MLTRQHPPTLSDSCIELLASTFVYTPGAALLSTLSPSNCWRVISLSDVHVGNPLKLHCPRGKH